MNHPEVPSADPAQPKPGFVRRWIGGIWRQQKEMAFGPRHRQVLEESIEAVGKVRTLKLKPTRVETFDEAVRRQGLSAAQIEKQLSSYKMAHLALYFLGGLLFVYAIYLTLNFSAFIGLGALIGSVGVCINGYLHGYRAWQIENRSLIRLQDALRIPGTYLVL